MQKIGIQINTLLFIEKKRQHRKEERKCTCVSTRGEPSNLYHIINIYHINEYVLNKKCVYIYIIYLAAKYSFLHYLLYPKNMNDDDGIYV